MPYSLIAKIVDHYATRRARPLPEQAVVVAPSRLYPGGRRPAATAAPVRVR